MSSDSQNRPAKNSVLRSSSKMAVATLSSRVLGLVREQVIAAYFGASGVTDAFLVAYRIPNLLRDLFAEGAFSSAFVPVFTEVKQKDPEAAKALFWSLFILLGSVTTLVSILIAIFAPELIGVFAPKFAEDPQKFELTVNLTRVMAPFLVLVSIAALFMGALNTLKIFFVPSFAPAFYNLLMILSIVFLSSTMESRGFHPVFALGVGVICGGLGQALIQFPLLLKNNYGPKGPIKLVSTETKKIMNRIGIGTVGIAATQINVLINTILATGTVVGAVSWLGFGFRLFQFPVGILGVSLAGSNLVHFSDAWKRGEKEEAVGYLSTSYGLSFLVMLPALSLLMALAEPTVSLIFERGAFDREDTLMTALALKYYLLGLPFYGLYKIFVPVFYALDKPKLPVLISIGSIAVNIIFCISLVPKYGFGILALGTSLSICLNAITQGVFLGRELDLCISFFLNLRVVKAVIAAVITFLLSYLIGKDISLDASFMERVTWFILSGLAGSAGYFLSLLVLGELKGILGALKR